MLLLPVSSCEICCIYGAQEDIPCDPEFTPTSDLKKQTLFFEPFPHWETTANIPHSHRGSSIEKKQVTEDNICEKKKRLYGIMDKEHHTGKAAQWDLGFSTRKTAVEMHCLAISLLSQVSLKQVVFQEPTEGHLTTLVTGGL